jgi:hypothetical protein
MRRRSNFLPTLAALVAAFFLASPAAQAASCSGNVCVNTSFVVNGWIYDESGQVYSPGNPPPGSGGGGGGSGTVTSVGLALPASLFSVSGSPVTTAGTLTAAFLDQSANTIFAGPTSGVALPPSFRALVGTDLPLPGPASLGGVESYTAPANEVINSISTAGVPGAVQLGFANLSGTITPSQCVPGTASAIGCLEVGTGLSVSGGVASLAATLPTGEAIPSPTLSGTVDGNPTFSGNLTFGGGLTATDLSTGTQVSCLGLSSANAVVLSSAACGSGGGSVSITAATPDVTLSPSPLTGTGTIGTKNPEIAENVASLTLSGSTPCAGNDSTCYPRNQTLEITYSSGAVPVSLAAPSATGFGSNFVFRLATISEPTTITPASGTINGQSSLLLYPGQWAAIWANAASTGYIAAVTGQPFRVETAQTGNYTVAAADAWAWVNLNSSSAATFTLPQSTASFLPPGSEICFAAIGAGALTVTPSTSTIYGAGITLSSGSLALAANGWACLEVDASNNYFAVGSGGGGGGGASCPSGFTAKTNGCFAIETVSGSEFTWTGLSNGEYHLRCYGITSASGSGNVAMQFTENNGSSWLDTDYQYIAPYTDYASGWGANGATAAAYIQITTAPDTASTDSNSGELDIHNLQSSALRKSVDGTWNQITGGNAWLNPVAGMYYGDTGAIDGIRIANSSSSTDLSGTCSLQLTQ